MAQRNPLNPRYQGEGPGGQTKKSAASAKPVSEAASSVRIKGKPTTASEKKAAAKSREREAQRKAAEKDRKAKEKAKAEAATDESATAETVDIKPAEPVAAAPKQNFFQKLFSPTPNMPNTPEYKMWRRRYWMLMAAGIACVTFSWLFQTILSNVFTLWVIFMVLAYVCIALAFFVDFKRVRPLIKEYQKGGGGGKKSPKQLKHEQESAQRAAELEAARKAAKEAKRKPLLGLGKKKSDS